MPMHDWTRVDAGIYHHFHTAWIIQIQQALMQRLPEDYYCLAEQRALGFGPDLLTLGSQEVEEPDTSGGTAIATQPRTRIRQETPADFYPARQRSVVVRHASGDRIVAVIEVISPGNKNSNHGIRSFVTKARELLDQRIHLLLIDPIPVNERNPHGLHALIADFLDEPYQLPPEMPLSLIAYERSDDTIRAYLEPFAVGDALIDMPIFLRPGFYVEVPLEATYQAAWEAVPRRWQTVIERHAE